MAQFCEGETGPERKVHRRPEYKVVVREEGKPPVTRVLCPSCCDEARLWARARGRDQVELDISLLSPAVPGSTTVLHEPSRS